jgi:SAM-dependent methyltransferase
MKTNGLTLDERNTAFWDELCGSSAAKSLGITDRSAESLKKFDDWYFGYYPYLDRYIPFEYMTGKLVLEVGLGYGSVSQRIGEAGANYVGLDISRGPVAMANYRCRLHSLHGQAIRGSILQAPFGDSTFDYIVAIGSYHHTGNLQRAIDESHRLLKPEGTLVMMVYNAYSYRRWIRSFYSAGQYFFWERFHLGQQPVSSAEQRAAYDTNAKKEAAPYTTFVSRHHLATMCRRFSQFNASLENVGQEGPLYFFPRNIILQPWPQFIGLDIYAVAKK